MKYLIIFCCLLLISKEVKNQNLLYNKSFEEFEEVYGKNNTIYEDIPKPHFRAHFSVLKHWEDDMEEIECSNTDLNVHSPDYYRNDRFNSNASSTYLQLIERIIPENPIDVNDYEDVTVQSKSGNAFVGIAGGELIQQKLANTLITGDKYTLVFYYRLFDDCRAKIGNSGGLEPNFETNQKHNTVFHLLSSNQKIEYLNDDCYCTEASFFAKKNKLFQWINDVGQFNLNTNANSTGKWHKAVIEFIAPGTNNGNNNNDWIALEIQNACNTYIAIDDVSLLKCEKSCSRTWGDVVPCITLPTTVNYENPFKVECIENVSEISLRIIALNGGIVVFENTEASIDGIIYPIVWPGIDNGGTPLAAANYLIEISYSNDCGIKTEVIQVHIDHTDSEFISLPQISKPSPNELPKPSNLLELTPKPCCEFEPNIYLDDITLDRNYPIEFRAFEAIYAATNSLVGVLIKSHTEVLFRAGEVIELGDGFETQNNVDFLAEIIPCPELKKAAEFSSSNNDVTFNKSQDPAFFLHPNPHREQFTLSQTEEGYIKSYKIIDVMGRVMLSATFGIGKEASINTSNLAKGIYILHLETTQGLKAERIVKE